MDVIHAKERENIQRIKNAEIRNVLTIRDRLGTSLFLEDTSKEIRFPSKRHLCNFAGYALPLFAILDFGS